ncbi:MAG: universal stress protein [Nitrososphaera sp.]|jgi:nucleotide-binding universal stress UspA family protein
MSAAGPVQTILVPIDGSENAYRAASFAIDLAHRYGAKLIAIHALETNPSFLAVGVYGAAYPQNIDKILEAAGKEAAPWFERVKKEADALNVRMASEVIHAPLSLVGEIVNYAEENNVSLIVIGSKGRTGFKKLLMGSVSSGVVTYAPCPVLVVK